MDKLRVLLIDDSEIAVTLARIVLEKGGFDVRAVGSIEEVDEILRSWAPNIVLTDLIMPGVSGAELCRRIKLSIETHAVPVVLFSSAPEAELAMAARVSGADAYYAKSHGLTGLCDKLLSLCEDMVW